MDSIYPGLKTAANTPKVEHFRAAHGQMMLEGLVSRGYAEIDKNDYVHLTLQGARALLDFEGLWKR